MGSVQVRFLEQVASYLCLSSEFLHWVVKLRRTFNSWVHLNSGKMRNAENKARNVSLGC